MTEISNATEWELTSPPDDGISSLSFSPQENTMGLLLVSSWDSTVRLYDTEKNTQVTKFLSKAAVLDCTFSTTSSEGFSAGLDRNLKRYDFNTGTESVVGSHSGAIRCVEYSKDMGGWDTNVRTWDGRNSTPTNEIKESGKIFSLSTNGTKLITANSERKVCIYDLRKPQEPELVRDSPLKYQTRTVAYFPDGSGYAVGSIEGRVGLEFFNSDPSRPQRKSYAFKCHRQKLENQTLVFPVNVIAFHPTYGTFTTGGCDGMVNIWDGDQKKRIGQLRKYPTSIASLAFNCNGSRLAIASSYTFEEGRKDHPNDSIHIRAIQDSDVRPKAQPAPTN